ncbi:MAG: hypothetical protein V1835_00665 [Candidatus Micrarchaeota archaeon]
MNKIFLTQEIGSIQRPIWRQKLDAPVNKAWIDSAKLWGERLGVEELGELIGILRKDGKSRTLHEKQRIIEIASIYVIRMFERAGLDRVFNGEQPRTEMYDFLARNTEGIATAGTLNSFDANYFKKGIIESELKVKKEGIKFFTDEYSFVSKHTARIVKPCLTGAYTMMDWSYAEYHRKKHETKGANPLEALKSGRRDALLDFARNVLNPIVKELANAGAEVIQIDEPAAATNEQESELFVEATNESFKGIPSQVEKSVHLCYSDYTSLFPALADCNADSYLIEFTNHASPINFKPDDVDPRTYKALKLFKEHGMDVSVGLGVVDIHSDFIETPQVVRDRILYAAKVLGDPAKVQINPDCGLRTRQWFVSYAKLLNMAEGAALARAEYGD